MKKKTLWFMLTVVLTLALALPMASPSLAWSGASTDVDITAVPGQVPCEGGSVLLKITEYNDSESWVYWGFTDVSVELQPIGGDPLIKGDSYWIGGDSNNDSNLDPGETWEWQRSVWVDTDTTFVAIGRGTTDDGVVMTWYENPNTPGHDPDERAEVPVTVGPCDDFEGRTPGYWKNHLDSWPVDPQTAMWSDYFDVGPNMPLVEALALKGGKDNALTRHAAAAVLNILSGPGYPMTLEELKDLVDSAYGTPNWESAKNVLDEFNNLSES